MYDPETDNWSDMPHPCAPLSDFPSAYFDDAVYTIGGVNKPQHYWFGGGCPTSNTADTRSFCWR